jgi:hypothetical protein
MTSDNRDYPAGDPPPIVLPYARPPGPGGPTPAELYAQVPWFRRNAFSSTLILIALACWLCSPIFFAFAASRIGRRVIAIPAVLLLIVAGLALVTVCVIVLTGPVYLPRALPDGRLKTWGIANKVIAALFLIIWAWIAIAMMHGKR